MTSKPAAPEVCPVCGKGFRIYWERTSRDQQSATLPSIQQALREHHDDPASLGLTPLPSNVHIARWLSHEDFLPRCAALVTTGGAATVLASLKAGVPLLVAPTFWDKSDNAQRVVEAEPATELACSARDRARIYCNSGGGELSSTGRLASSTRSSA